MNRKLTVAAIAVVVLLAAAWGANRWMGNGEAGVAASGTLEARNISVGSKVGGRVTEVLVREGDRVEAGQPLVRFDDAELEARVLQARGRVAQARANLAKLEKGFRPEEVAEAQAASGSRAAEVQQSSFELTRAKAELENARRNHERVASLVQQGIMAKAVGDDAEARLAQAQAQVEALERAVGASQGRLQAAKASESLTRRGFRTEDIAAARAELMRADGEMKEAEARWAEREVRSPAAAVVEVLDIRPGDLLSPNAPLAKLLEADQLYVMVYVPQTQIGRVRIGQNASVRVDTFGEETFPATVEQIRQQAEFLPRNVQTSEERVHQVIGVKLRVENRDSKLRAGIHAEVRFAEAR